MSVIHVTIANFQSEVIESSLPVLVDFFADWCGPCKVLGPVVEELAGEFAGKLKVCKLNIDDGQDIAAQYSVMSVPTLIFFKSGKNVEQLVGVLPKPQLVDAINKVI